MKDLVIGLHSAARSAQETIERIAKAEDAGIEVAWLTSGGVARDPLAIFAAAAMRTSRIEFGTCILPTFPRHPLAMAQGALTVDDLAPGRLRLGIGPSHEPGITGTYGLSFERPLQHLREYLAILNALLKDGKVSFHGKRLHAEAEIPAPAPVRVMMSALRRNAFLLAGELSDGGITWVTPMNHVEDVARPAIEEGARKAGRGAPPVIVHQPIVVSTNSEAVQQAALRQFGFYPRLPFYSGMWQDAGYEEAAGGQFSERMAKALVIAGDEDEVERRVREMPTRGAGEMIADIVVLRDEPESMDRTVRFLGKLAQSD